MIATVTPQLLTQPLIATNLSLQDNKVENSSYSFAFKVLSSVGAIALVTLVAVVALEGLVNQHKSSLNQHPPLFSILDTGKQSVLIDGAPICIHPFTGLLLSDDNVSNGRLECQISSPIDLIMEDFNCKTQEQAKQVYESHKQMLKKWGEVTFTAWAIWNQEPNCLKNIPGEFLFPT